MRGAIRLFWNSSGSTCESNLMVTYDSAGDGGLMVSRTSATSVKL
jgi:hypothetical protein